MKCKNCKIKNKIINDLLKEIDNEWCDTKRIKLIDKAKESIKEQYKC